MNRFSRLAVLGLVVVASIWSAKPARAQDTAKTKTPAVSTSDSVTIADVQKAADDLVFAVQAAVRKATEDPAVKLAALKVAKSAVTTAQVVVTQQAETLQAVLDALAKQIAMAAEKQESKARNH